MNTTPVRNVPQAQLLPIDAVILDMDGTLIESTEADFLAWKALFADHNRVLTFQEYMPLLGVRSVDLVQQKLHLTGDALQEALQKKMDYFREVVADNGIKTVPFVEALMKNLKSYPVRIALATSSRREKMKLLMEKVGFLPYFDAIVTGEEVTNGKPAPDIFLQAAERLHVPAGKCMVIEDAASGVKAAKSAQMKCIAITTTHPANQLQLADLVIDSFENASLGAWCSQLK